MTVIIIICVLVVAGFFYFIFPTMLWNNQKKREETLIKRAESGETQALYDLGMLYKKCKNLNEAYHAVKWFKKAAEQGIVAAGTELRYCKNILENRINGLKKQYVKYKFNNYLAIEACCIELEKKGYECHYGEIEHHEHLGTKIHKAKIYVADSSIEFGTHKHDEYTEYCRFPLNHLSREHIYGKHMLQLDKASIYINSRVSSSDDPPEWMMICAKVLSLHFTICYPEWVEENPDAKEYVNVAFRILKKL